MQTGPHPVSPTCDKRLERFWMDSPFPQIQKQSACQFLWTVDRTVRWSAAQESLTSHASLMIDAGHSCGIVELDSDWVTIQSSTEGTTKSPRVSECWLECGFSTNDQVHYTDCSELLAIPSGIWSELEPWKSLSRKLYSILLDLLRQETGRDERIFLTSKVEDLLATIGVFLSGGGESCYRCDLLDILIQWGTNQAFTFKSLKAFLAWDFSWAASEPENAHMDTVKTHPGYSVKYLLSH